MKLHFRFVCMAISLLVFAACTQESTPTAETAPAAEAAPVVESVVEATTETTPPVEVVPAALIVSGDIIATDNGDLVIQPINHATFAMSWGGQTIYVDPVGGAASFDGLPSPDLILITDIHGDHLDAETLQAVVTADTLIVAPAAVVEGLPEGMSSQSQTIANGEETSVLGLNLEAIPMYNLTEDRLKYHDKGRGNGYVLTIGGKRIYISGDTEDIPEMRALENIDFAFVCFNLPYTMTEVQAASAVVEFAPAVVYPYHFGESDVNMFAELVAEGGGNTEVRQRAWY
jgi:L-ascorbate metabolism protein UlaG (beta-lactamase superfamily)